jgi:hypothetical protein
MPETYKIPVRLDLAPAFRDADRLERLLERVEQRQSRRAGGTGGGDPAQAAARNAQRAADAAVKAKEREARQIAAIEDRAFMQDYRRQGQRERAAVAASERAAKAEERAASRAAAAAERSATAQVRSAERKAAQIAAIEDRYLKRDYDRRVDLERRKQQEATGRREGMIAGAGRGLKMGATAAGAAFLEYSGRRAASEKDAVDKLLTARESVRPVAALMRVNEDTALDRMTALRKEAGVDAGFANEFVENYLGSAGAGIEKGEASGGREGITRAVSDEFMKLAVGRAKLRRSDPASAADLAGTLSNMVPIRSAAAGMDLLGQVQYALDPGRGTEPVLTRQTLKSMTSITGEGRPMPSPVDAAAWVGALTMSAGPTEAGTRTEQLVRAFEQGFTDKDRAPHMKRLGIEPGQSLDEWVERISPSVRKDPKTAKIDLAKMGFTTDESQTAIYEGVMGLENKRRVTADIAAGKFKTAAQEEESARVFRSQLGAVRDITGAEQDRYDFERARKNEAFYADVARAGVSDEARADDRSFLTYGMDLVRSMSRMSLDPAVGRQVRIEEMVRDQAQAEANQAGANPLKTWSMVPQAALFGSGDNPNSENYNAFKEMTKALKENTASNKELTRANGGAGAGPPAPRAPRNQGRAD